MATTSYPDLAPARQNWGWFLVLGLLLIVLGMITLSTDVFFSEFIVVFLGWFLLIGGVIHFLSLFASRSVAVVFIHLFTGLLSVVAGLFFIRDPVQAMIGLTLLFAIMLTIGGLSRAITALSVKYRGWFSSFLTGLITMVLGIAVWAEWPRSGLFFIGLYVSVEMILQGITSVALALALRATPPH